MKPTFTLTLLLLCALAFVGFLLFAGETGIESAGAPATADGVAEHEPMAAGSGTERAPKRARVPTPSAKVLLRGRVWTRPEEPWVGGTVRLRWLAFGEWDEEIALDQRSVTTDGNGRFSFADGPDGAASLQVVEGDEVLARRNLVVPRRSTLDLDLSNLVRASAEPLPQRVESVTGSVSVSVVGPAGQPIPGVVVRMFRDRARPPLTSTTNPRGRCRFTDLPECAFILTAESGEACSELVASGIRFLSQAEFRRRAQLLPLGHESRCVVELRPWARISGRSLDEAGQPVAHASVLLTATDRAFRHVIESGPDGRFRAPMIPGKEYQLSENSPEGGWQIPNPAVDSHPALNPRAERTSHIVRCRQPVPVRLRILDEERQPVPGAIVVSSKPPGLAFSSNRHDYMIGEIPPQRSDSAGRVAFEVWPGSYFLLFVHARGKRSDTVFFDVRGLGGKEYPARVERELTLRDQPVDVIQGVVADSTGAPVEGVHVRGVAEEARRHYMGPAFMEEFRPAGAIVTFTDEAGRFVLTGTDKGKEHEIRCTSAEHAEFRKLGVRGGEANLRIQLAPPRVFSGRVVLASGAPVPGIEIHRGASKSPTDAEGRFEVELRGAGTETLWVLGEAFYPERILIESASPNGRDVVVKPRAVVAGRLLDPDGRPIAMAKLNVTFRHAVANPGHTLATDSEGRYRFPWPGWNQNEEPHAVVVRADSMPDRTWSQVLAEAFDPRNPPLNLQFARGLEGSIRVVDARGVAIPEMFVSPRWGRGWASPQDENGRFRLWGMRDKRVELHLHGAYETLDGKRRIEVELGEPERTVTVRKRQR